MRISILLLTTLALSAACTAQDPAGGSGTVGSAVEQAPPDNLGFTGCDDENGDIDEDCLDGELCAADFGSMFLDCRGYDGHSLAECLWIDHRMFAACCAKRDVYSYCPYLAPASVVTAEVCGSMDLHFADCLAVASRGCRTDICRERALTECMPGETADRVEASDEAIAEGAKMWACCSGGEDHAFCAGFGRRLLPAFIADVQGAIMLHFIYNAATMADRGIPDSHDAQEAVTPESVTEVTNARLFAKLGFDPAEVRLLAHRDTLYGDGSAIVWYGAYPRDSVEAIAIFAYDAAAETAVGVHGECPIEACSCAADNDRCGDRCVELDRNGYNCGACGVTCTADEFCSGAICRPQLTPAFDGG